MTRAMQWKRGYDTRAAQAMRQAVQTHINARVAEGLYAPRKRELAEMLKEAAENTAKMQLSEEKTP